MEVISSSRLGCKRARDYDVPSSEEFLIQEPASLKKLCGGCDIRDAYVSSLFGTVAEVDELLYDIQGELSEAQERLLFGVMRSLEEELGVSRPLSPVSSANVNDNSSSLKLDADSNFVVESTDCLDLRIEDNTSNSSDDEYISYTGECPLPSVDAKYSESTDLLDKSPQIPDTNYPQLRADSRHAELVSLSPLVKLELGVKIGADIGYLLGASDDELGIFPISSSENSNAGADLVSYSCRSETDYKSTTESALESLDPAFWQYGSDWSSGSHFDIIDFESDPATQEWMKNAVAAVHIQGG